MNLPKVLHVKPKEEIQPGTAHLTEKLKDDGWRLMPDAQMEMENKWREIMSKFRKLLAVKSRLLWIHLSSHKKTPT